mmetsp:Transcript_17536/g.24365  ORF Transcript_17536/g.24365 Transcript_17536/m.24365 type:complete len:234 (-) Transcript_17536:20-721(-)
MLMVTTTMGMLYGILCHTTNLGPAVTLDTVLVVGISSLQKGLIGTSTSSDDTNLGTDIGGDSLLTSRRQTKTSGSLIFVVGDNDSKGTGSTGKGTTVTNLGFDVADNGTLGDRGERQDVSNSQGGLTSTVDELTSVHTLGTKQKFRVTLVTVGVQELNLGHGGTTTGIVHNVLDDTTNVTALLRIVQRTKLDGTLTGTGVGCENRPLTLSLNLDVFSHREARSQLLWRVNCTT